MFKKSRKKPKTEIECLNEQIDSCSSQMPKEELYKVLSSVSNNLTLIDKIINAWERRQHYYRDS